MQAVDRSLASVMQALRRAGVEDDTVVVYLSDQGFYFGEHRIALGKTKPYAESVRVPMVARIPRTILGRRARPVVRETVANIDLAPTFLDLAGATPCAAPDSCIVPDGRSLLPLVSGVSSESFVDRAVLVELGWPCESYNAYWSNDEAYVEWFADQSEGASPCEIGWRELYDLRGDPLQITNLLDLHEARYGARSSEGPDERLHALMECEGTTGPRACE